MVSAYVVGRYYEYKFRDILEKKGWLVIRAAKSAPIDLVAIRGQNTILFEIKKNGPKSAPEKFVEVLNQAGAGGIYVSVIGGLCHWQPINVPEDVILEMMSIFGPNIIRQNA